MDVIPRSVRRRRGQWLIPLPSRARAHLGIDGDRPVYWHIRRRGEVTLTLSTTRTGGHPLAVEHTRQLRAIERENRRLRAQLAARPLAQARARDAQTYLQALKVVSPIDRQLGAILDALHQLIERVGGLPGAPRRRVRRPTRRDAATPAPMDAPASPPPPADAVVDGGADTSGAEPPGVPPIAP